MTPARVAIALSLVVFATAVRADDLPKFRADCKVNGVDMRSTTVMVREGDSAYRLTVDSQAGDKKTKEVLVAKRIGDCKK